MAKRKRRPAIGTMVQVVPSHGSPLLRGRCGEIVRYGHGTCDVRLTGLTPNRLATLDVHHLVALAPDAEARLRYVTALADQATSWRVRAQELEDQIKLLTTEATAINIPAEWFFGMLLNAKDLDEALSLSGPEAERISATAKETLALFQRMVLAATKALLRAEAEIIA